MARWKYTLKSGSTLREAIHNEDTEQVVKCLRFCYEELYKKLSKEDREYCWSDIEDTLVELAGYEPDEDDEDYINELLANFYDLCDDVRAWIGGI